MEKLFGIPMTSIMVVMLALLGICLLSVAFIAWRRPVIFKLGIRNIPRRKAQTTLIVVGLMLATLIISAALGTGDTLNRSVNSVALRLIGPLDELVLPASDDEGNASLGSIFTETMPESNVDLVRTAVAGSDKVDAVAGVLISQAPVLNLGQADPSSLTSMDSVMEVATASNPQIYIAGLNQETVEDIGGLKDEAGDPVDVSTLGADAIYISRDTADDLDLAAGDTIAFISGNTPYFATVRGIVPDTVLTGSINAGTGSMLMDLGRLQEITGKDGQISAIGVSNTGGTREGLTHSDEVTGLLRENLAADGLGVVPFKQDQVDQAELLASIFVTMFVVFGLFSIGVGILLIVLIFTMLAAERRAEMGMERAVGAQRRQLIQQFIAEGAGYTLLSGLVGTGLGVVATWAIAQGFKGFAEDQFAINLYVTPRSLVIAYSLGVVITFLAVAISSWRVSRLNVVSAIRDIPDVYRARRNRKQLVWGIVMVLAGAGLMLTGMSSKQQAPFTIGMTLLPLGVAAILTFFGANSRLVLTLAGIYLLVFWLMPGDLFSKIFGEMNGNIEMFFVSGICIVAASTLVIVQNLDAILSAVTRVGGALRSLLPSVRLAVSYPGANKSRAGMTIAMFSLIVFSLVMVAAINNNFVNAFLGDQANAGMEIRVDIPGQNPLDDFTGTLEQKGIDTSEFTGVGKMLMVDTVDEALGKDGDWDPFMIQGMDEGYLEHANLSFQAHAEGYESDEAILDALRTDPDAIVINSMSAEDAQAAFGMPQTRFAGVPSTGTFAPTTVEVRGNGDEPRNLKVIGVLDSKLSMLLFAYTGPAATAALMPDSAAAPVSYYIDLKDGADAKVLAADIERVLLPYGAQGVDIEQEMKDGQAQQQTFMYVLQGFMGLGMIVGVAAVGVIAYRAVVERRQQIGVLRALGFQPGKIASAFVIESAIVVVLGAFAGAITGLILAWELMTSDEFTEGVSIDFQAPWGTIIATLAVAIIAALLMSWLPARQASRIHPAEALRYE